jgi:hypothetical protein
MAKHKRRAPFWVRRRTYLELLRAYQELEHHYRVLAGDRDALLAPDRPGPRVPSWAETEPIPVVTPAGLDTDKAAALLRRWGMSGSPAGSWSGNRGTTG